MSLYRIYLFLINLSATPHQYRASWGVCLNICISVSVANLHHFDADPDPTFHFDTDPDHTFHSVAVPDRDSTF